MDGACVAQPNRVSPGAAWLVYGYKHPDMSDTQAWRNTTEWVTFFHGSLWYGAQNIMKNNYILPSAKEELGHRNLGYQGEAGVYTSPHMYTSIYYVEPHVLFEDGVYTGVCFINLQLVVSLFFHKEANGNQYVFASRQIQITHVWVQPYASIAKGDRKG